ncbi:AAA family ATPase [Geovibrio thiophilus]|uniref:AAA family ATPase n=1 Tax=Geovibrio thiophilus TaxID=139438 RepID=A0A410K1V8_9BACT|nr:AAA family ATPase [Geovibrio thiophilus]QAR34394.1 AAA family ATPase [Geovibrio thiophilus]
MFDFEIWFAEQALLLKKIPEKNARYLYGKINWNNPCIGILGARGTGKTTLMMQFLKSADKGNGNALYVSVDNPRFQGMPLNEFAAEFAKSGGELLCLDEVHKYPDWSKHIKAIHDTRPDLKVVFSGSSLLQMNMQDADLSRRAVFYHLDGLSFREYLNLAYGYFLSPYQLADIISDHIGTAGEILGKIPKILKYFAEYLSHGCYPFFLADKSTFHMRLANTVREVLETDMGFVCDIKYAKIHQIKKLLYMLAVTPPYDMKKTGLSGATGIDRVTMNEYLIYLREAGLVNLIKPEGRGDGVVRKTEKLLIANPNILYAISTRPEIGTVREVFFVNQIGNYYRMQDNFLPVSVEYARNGDYSADGRVFEIGGKSKSSRQIKNIENAFIVSDDIEIGYGNRIPLWLFGMMY